jgi:hypothetical protein
LLHLYCVPSSVLRQLPCLVHLALSS